MRTRCRNSEVANPEGSGDWLKAATLFHGGPGKVNEVFSRGARNFCLPKPVPFASLVLLVIVMKVIYLRKILLFRA